MPLYKHIKADSETDVFVWKISEEEVELRRDVNMQEKHQKRYENMLSESHRKGFLSVRKLLQAAGYTDFDLNYDSNGKPSLADGKHISITHSFEFSAIIISTKNVRSEEHTSELQSRPHLVCRLLLEKKNIT